VGYPTVSAYHANAVVAVATAVADMMSQLNRYGEADLQLHR
jgi:hypothetical protein